MGAEARPESAPFPMRAHTFSKLHALQSIIRNMDKTLRKIVNAVQAEQSGFASTQDAHKSALDSAWLDSLVRARNREMHDGKRTVAKKRLLPAYMRMRREEPEKLNAWGAPVGGAVDTQVIRLLRAKPRRTASGVATITVLTKPWCCSGDCVYCPNDIRMPKSYLSDEPACQRAERCFFDPYIQVLARLRVLEDMGHVTDKVELIVLGGTWSDYPREYQLWFISQVFRALNDAGTNNVEDAARRSFYEECGLSCDPAELREQVAHVQNRVNEGELSYNDAWRQLYGESPAWQRACSIQHATLDDLEHEQMRNECAAHRCVGLVVETRPETITPNNLVFLRMLGCTKLQVGIQSLDERVLAASCRPTKIRQIEQAFELMRLFGFKSHVHMMVNLPNATLESERLEYETLMSDPRFQPDELKLYPCCLVESSRLGEMMRNGTWQPYAEEDLISLLAADVMNTRPYSRISRMIRDISAKDILAGNKKTNLRQMVEAHLQQSADGDATPVRPAEMRLREIGVSDVCAEQLRLETLSYQTTVSEERFLQWVTEDGHLAAFLRLSLPYKHAVQRLQDIFRELHAANAENSGIVCETGDKREAPIQPDQAMIREVHVYGKVAALHHSGESAQHLGLGRKLIEQACSQAAACGYTEMNVISAVGTRNYYRSLGFCDAGLYQRKPILL